MKNQAHQDYDQHKLSSDLGNDFYLHQRQTDGENESSGLGLSNVQNEGSYGMRMVRSSLMSSDEYKNGRAAQIKSSEDLTLDMLGSSNRTNHQNYQAYVPQQLTSKNPPSSALNLLDVKPDITLEQYRQNNANLQNILMQFDSTPQFTAMPKHDSAPQHLKQRQALGQYQQNEAEVSQFSYMQAQYRQKPESDQIDKIRENLSKIELLQQAIHQPGSNQSQNRRVPLQQAGFQILQNENKNPQNLKVEKAHSLPNQDQILNNHKSIMSQFDDIPISKIKNMVGYQTNIGMYEADAKLPPVDDQEGGDIKAFATIKEQQKTNDSDDDEGDLGLALEDRVHAAQWKTRMRAAKEINQLFYNDYAKNQSDPSHQMISFEQYSPLLQEMIKDTNLPNQLEALNCLYTFVRFAQDIKHVTFSCHNFLLEKVNTTKPAFRDITLKIILQMMQRLHGSQNTITSELLKRFKSKNSKCAIFCLQVVVEAFKSRDQKLIQDINLKNLFASIQTGLTHQNKEIRDAAYQLLKSICEKCKDEPQQIIQQCLNLRPVQIKELNEELSKLQKDKGVLPSLFDNIDEEVKEVISKKEVKVVDDIQKQEPETYDLMTIVPDDFQEIPYMNQINTKKKSMEQFNQELSKIISSKSSIKPKDYSMVLNVVFHMLEDKNMLVFMEAIKSVELLSVLNQLKAAKVKPFIVLLAGKYGETKTAVIQQTDKAMQAIVKHSLTATTFADTVINQIVQTHKNPRVKQFLLTNPLTQMLQTVDSKELISVFKSINKSLVQLVLKDNNDQVRNAAVSVVIEFGLLFQNDDVFQQQLQLIIGQLPKARIQEINKKLLPEEPQLSKTVAPLRSKTMNADKTPVLEGEFAKTLEPVKSVTSFYTYLMTKIKNLSANKEPASVLQQNLDEAIQNREVVAILVSKRQSIIRSFCDVLSVQMKLLTGQKDQILVLFEFIKELLMDDITNQINTQAEELSDFLTIGLLLTELGVDQDAGQSSQMLVLGFESQHDSLVFFDVLRSVVELPQIMHASQSITIISNVYLWLGLKLNEFIRAGVEFEDIEDLRGLGIKYLESTQIFNEQQRQQLIAVMIRFKEQIQKARQDSLQTLGQQTLQPTARSNGSDARQQTAQFQVEKKQEITAQLICQTIDKEFEQGLLMFKELAQQSQLDFETKDMIFSKLLSIISEGQSNQNNQQYRQAYALKALMWMKEETMGLEDTFKLTCKVLSVYLGQMVKDIDASVELYLMNFWVKDLSIRDLCDRVQATVQGNTTKSSKLQGFIVLFQWLEGNRLANEDWKIADLRKIALLICESVLVQKYQFQISQFIEKCVAKESKEKVLEFMEIQLMHSNDVFLLFLDWFNSIYNKPNTSKVDVEVTAENKSKSYIERRQQMKTSNLKQKQDEQVKEISRIEEELPQSRLELESRRSRYDQHYGHMEDVDGSNEEVKANQTAQSDAQNESLYEKVQQSEVKQQQWVSKIISLEAEKRRIEEETRQLRQQTDQQSYEWQQKLQQMQLEHSQVNASLNEVNQCYLQQVEENEGLRQQLKQMQQQHSDMLQRFDQLEQKVNQERPITPPRQQRPQSGRNPVMNSVAKLQRISDTFCIQDQQIGIGKICELLLSVERNVDGELAKPLIAHYCKMRTVEERLSMITAVGEALSFNEDVLLALSIDVYKALLNFLLRAFAHEKERLDTQSMGRQEQNQVTMESQKLVSRLLNSKDFTSSLVVLFQLLREAMPEDLVPALPIEEGQYLRVLMRCISRITKALHSESSELIRGFDVLLEMQKIFVLCPPENLREDLPSLADFDFVFRGMKDVSDKFVELQQDKVMSFLGYCETRSQPENAFIRYLRIKTR